MLSWSFALYQLFNFFLTKFKVIVDADTDKIVGCTLFGPESSEVINLVAMAMKTGQEYTFLRDFIFTHPSMSEALNDLMNL